jgi:hypothetical protein
MSVDICGCFTQNRGACQEKLGLLNFAIGQIVSSADNDCGFPAVITGVIACNKQPYNNADKDRNEYSAFYNLSLFTAAYHKVIWINVFHFAPPPLSNNKDAKFT